MPQTMLAISAIVITGFLTLSQSEVSRRTTDSVVQDQFELAVAGTLLHTMEFVDSRAFDESTTPARLRARYGLPSRMTEAERDTITFDDFKGIKPEDFALVGAFGGGDCNVERPGESPGCDDIDDISDGAWRPVELTTPEGFPLPVEVKVDVTYVKAGAGDKIDEPITDPSARTFHKRIQVTARSTDAVSAAGSVKPAEVTLSRVISFDPQVAAEYVRRSITVDGAGPETCEARTGEWNARLAELRRQRDRADGDQRGAAVAAADARDAATAARTRAAQADDRAAAADRAVQDADAVRTEADRASRDAGQRRDQAVSTAQQANEARSQADERARQAAAAVQPARDRAASAKTTSDRAYDTAVADLDAYYAADAAYDDLLARFTHVGKRENGEDPNYRYFNAGVKQADKDRVFKSQDDRRKALDRFYQTRDAYYEARDASAAADREADDAQRASDAAAAALADARRASDDAARALADAEGAARDAADIARDRANAADAARQSRDAARADADAARSDADAADRAAADAGQREAEANDALAQADQAVRDHEGSRPQC